MKSYTGSIHFDAGAALGSRQFLPPSATRFRLVIFPPQGSRITIANDPISADGNGITLSPSSPPYEISWHSHGDMIFKPWFVFYNAGFTPVGWIEVFG